MKKSEWGPCIWKTIHCLTIQIKNEHFEQIKKELIHIIVQICSNLPCPICSSHASLFIRKHRIQSIKTKDHLIRFFFHLHNEVNKRLKKKPFSYEDVINTYKNENIKQTLSAYYNLNHQIKFSERLMNHGYHRKLFLENFKRFVRSNIELFHIIEPPSK